MSTTVVKIRQGMRSPAVEMTFVRSTGLAVDFTLYTGLVFRMKHITTGAVVTGTPTGDGLGKITYAWPGATDTNVLGLYHAVFEGTIGGKQEMFPTDDDDLLFVWVQEPPA